jgi:DNA-binding CsgD family transcriptional regulator
MGDSLRAIRDARSVADLWREASGYYAAAGFRALAYVLVGRHGGEPARTIVNHGFPEAFMDAHMIDPARRIDPLLRVVLGQGRPMRWSEVWQMVGDRAQFAFQAMAAAAGMTDGLALPCFGPHGRNAVFCIGQVDDAAVLSDRHVTALHMFAEAAHLHLCELVPVDDAPGKPLSARELEVLDLVAKGKSNGVIAEILAVSAGTIDTYLRRIYQKLDVADRTSAAVKGVGLGLIAA